MYTDFYYSHRLDIDALHDTEMKPQICKNMDDRIVQSEGVLYPFWT